MCSIAVGGIWLLKQQTISHQTLEKDARYGRFAFDEHGIPTVEATEWRQLIRAQGYLLAHERMWQMDVMRRQASGRLAEWFGEAALKNDIDRASEDWLSVADRGASDLSAKQREYCEVYADGINEFIAQQTGRWGLEYMLLRSRPEPWQCRDSLLILLLMADTLTSTAAREGRQWLWRRGLPKDWEAFLFPDSHPWNQPLFDANKSIPLRLPGSGNFLPKTPLQETEWAINSSTHADNMVLGSNSWAWRGPGGYFLANDPHLTQQIPQLWYAMRLRRSSTDWVVGAALPGVPGIAIGMNPQLAWSFTNVGEDVDDFLLEEVDESKNRYVAGLVDGNKEWRRIAVKRVIIKVRGKSDHEIAARFTHRGPLGKRTEIGDVWASRQWLPLKPGMLKLPTILVNQANNWQEANAAFDQMAAPAQNVIIVDRLGGIGYRASGTGVKRRVSGRWPQPAHLGEWRGFAPESARQRLWLPSKRSYENPQQLASANERIWVDEFGHNWANEDRKRSIREALDSVQNGSAKQMQMIQHNDKSEFLRQLMQWLASNTKKHGLGPNQDISAWETWSGHAGADPTTFSDALAAERFLLSVLTKRIAEKYLAHETKLPPYFFALQRAWLLLTMHDARGFAAFGLDDKDVAAHALRAVLRSREGRIPYFESNRWQKQHPFVGRIPILGNLFRVRELPQTGYDDLPKAESPTVGASMRIVWNLHEPSKSVWSFPVGQSGHPGSTFYRNLQDAWHKQIYFPVFTNQFDWGFVGEK